MKMWRVQLILELFTIGKIKLRRKESNGDKLMDYSRK